ncbi:MAG TPA: hypothetical protein DEQ25_03485, partial [Methylophaga sp.]|nr:hypothetical protein [Methylophaga sp.]
MVETIERIEKCEKHSIEYTASVMVFRDREIITECPECQKEANQKVIADELAEQKLHERRLLAIDFE